ncbi:MAG: ferrochelatase [Deltaproteobacteria bacterium]|nr:ferrochelatase [Deltaproteobacteria bacterium]
MARRGRSRSRGRGAVKTAVLLLNLGGPDSLEAVKPFLLNLFSDPEILRFPLSGLLQRPLARWIASRRTPTVIQKYRQIGGKSPLREITEAQARALSAELGPECSVHVAMRYWHPSAAEAARALRDARPERLLLLPLYPQFSRATTGSSLADLVGALRAEGLADLPTETIRSWQDFPPYVDALAEAVEEGLASLPRATILFSAHSLPVRLIEEGDPYLEHVRATAAAVAERLPGRAWTLAFQSRTGPVRWLEPSVPEALRQLASDGVSEVLVVPLSFVSDHIETLHEIDVEYRELAHTLGLRELRRTPSLNTRPAFIRALAELIRSYLKNPAA